jgi:transcriptional regulator with XRE-family HTH domain
MDYNKLGMNIRRIRKKNNLTIEQLAEKANISSNYLGKIERAQSILSVEVLVKIANALETTTDELLGNNIHTVSNKRVMKTNSQLNLLARSNPDYYDFVENIVDYMINKKA